MSPHLPAALALLVAVFVNSVFASQWDRIGSLRGALQSDGLPREERGGARLKRWSQYMPDPRNNLVKEEPEERVSTTRKVGAKKVKEAVNRVKKPVMSRINKFRVQLCWMRHNLLRHEKCLRFLGLMCSEGRTDLGVCKDFTGYVTDACEKFDQNGASEKQTEMHVIHCDVAEQVNPETMEPNEDEDGDGVINGEDAFPKDPSESTDLDGDGKGDNSDTDIDGDGVVNNVDALPRNPSETKDNDYDGTGDNTDPDDDNDGWPDVVDKFPFDPNEVADTDGDGIGDNADGDRDGDGHPNDEDTFPDDPARFEGTPDAEVAETEAVSPAAQIAASPAAPAPAISGSPSAPGPAVDTDKDGVLDIHDAFPTNKTEWADADFDGVGDNSDEFPGDAKEQYDSDKDAYGDNIDAFPHEPTEWGDSDGDGIGDNSDQYPLDPRCHSEPCVLPDGSLAPAAAALAPGAPGVMPAAPGAQVLPNGVVGGVNRMQAMVKPWHLNKVERPLPEQGYDEHSLGEIVDHNDGSTWTSDWQNERPQQGESEEEHVSNICDRHPDNLWCRKWRVDASKAANAHRLSIGADVLFGGR